MPQVPTAANQDYQPVDGRLPGIQANPDAFGASIGGALKGFGQQLDQASQQVGDRLATIAANNASNQFMDLSHKVTSGDPNNPQDTGYFGLSGQAAVDGRQAAFQKLNDGYKNIASALDPVAAQRFDDETRRMLYMTQGSLDQHFQQQVRVAGMDSAKASEQLATQGLSIYAADENGFQTQLQTLHKAVARQVAITGGGPDVLAASTQAADERAYAGRVQSLIGQGQLGLAQKVLEGNENMFSPPVFEELSQHLKPMLDKQQGEAVATSLFPQIGAPVGSADAIDAAIHGQESGGAATAPTSVDGARGGGQIMPATFAQYAQPGESIDNPADNAAVRKRITADYTQRYGGDASRVAVAYFSGPGNVAPAGSATPWLRDVADGNGTTTSAYVQGVLGRLGVNGQPKQPAAAFAPAVPDVATAVGKIEADPTLSMEAKQYAISKVTEYRNQMVAATAADRNTLEDNVKGGIAMLEAGKDYTPDAQAIRRLMPEKADGILADIDQARAVGSAANSVQFAAPSDIQAKMSQLKANLSASAPDGFVDNQQLLDTYQKAVDARNKQLAADPASYVAASPVVKTAADAISAADPKSVESYAMASLGEQARLGVAPADQRILSVGQANAAVAKLTSADPGTQDVGLMLSKITSAYGRFSNVALGDLVKAGLPAQYQMLAAMTPEPGQPDTQAATRSTFQGILKDAAAMGGTAKYRDSIPPADAKLIDSGVPDALRDFQATTRLNDGGQDLYANVAQSVKLMAYGLVAKQGLDGSTALAKAEQAIIGDKYDIDGTMLAPKGKMDDVQTATGNVLRGLKADDLADIGGNAALTAEQRQGIALDAAKRGTWVPNHDSSGLVLMGNRGDKFVPVRFKDGSQVQVLFDHLGDLAQPKVQHQTATSSASLYVDPGLPDAPLPRATTE